MLRLLKSLFQTKRSIHPRDENVLVFAELKINPDSEVQVNLRYGDTVPDGAVARVLVILALYQAANIYVNLQTEPVSIQSFYQGMMNDILSHWPKAGIEETGAFFRSLPFFTELVGDPEISQANWAANGGETIDLRLARTAGGALCLYDYYPGMPGCGPPGLAMNLALHYLFLMDFVLTLLDGPTCETLGQLLSELWLTLLRTSSDNPSQVNRPTFYAIVNEMLEQC